MNPTLAELIAALPDSREDAPFDSIADEQTQAMLRRMQPLSAHPAPTGRLHRLWVLGGLQAQIALAYAAYAVRSLFRDASAAQRDLMETNLRTALRALRTMSYLRGAIAKTGQLLACFPDVAPDAFVETLEMLHSQAPPMHFSLLRERLVDELGGEPEEVFASFERKPFAAASLGQVHRARLKSGEPAAVKVQYPGIGRAVRADMRNLAVLFQPLRMTRKWSFAQAHLEQVQRVLAEETDYELEAENLRRARALFREDDEIIVPRVFAQHSTRRVLTMDYIDGVHVGPLLGCEPSQAERDALGAKIATAVWRLYFGGRMIYSDQNPGNFLFMPDGRLGLIDLGGVIRLNDRQWNLMRLGTAALRGEEDVRTYVRRFAGFADGERADARWLELSERFVRWCWKPYLCSGAFDYGDVENLREGIDLFIQFSRLGDVRGEPVGSFVARFHLAHQAMQYRLKARINAAQIAVQEMTAAGWN